MLSANTLSFKCIRKIQGGALVVLLLAAGNAVAEDDNRFTLACEYMDGDTPHTVNINIDLANNIINGVPADGAFHINQKTKTKGFSIIRADQFTIIIDDLSDDDDSNKQEQIINRLTGALETNVTMHKPYQGHTVQFTLHGQCKKGTPLF